MLLLAARTLGRSPVDTSRSILAVEAVGDGYRRPDLTELPRRRPSLRRRSALSTLCSSLIELPGVRVLLLQLRQQAMQLVFPTLFR
jgi:hypothetical protein